MARKAAFSRPEPGFSLYEGRTRGKRMKYTFSDEEMEDSDALSVRRSTRNSGRVSPAAPAVPTVTASGRQVKSRATGMYGESLLSGQTTERASPATGDYVRSEGSEEPERPSHGRSTRAANRSTADGWAKGRKHVDSYNSLDDMDDEEDATSWDGGDEDEDEPDQMDIDDRDDESGNEPSDVDEPQHLVVRLRYRKGASGAPKLAPATKRDGLTKSELASKPGPAAVGAPLTGMDAARQQPVLALAPAPAATAKPSFQALPPPSALISTVVPNGIPSTQEPTSLLPMVAPAAPEPPPAGDAQPLPHLNTLFRAPTPPYTAQETQKPPFPPAADAGPAREPAPGPGPFTNGLPAPTTI